MREPMISDAQLVAIVHGFQADGVTIESIAKKHCITQTRVFRWRKRLGGPESRQAAELLHLQSDNARL